MICVWVSVVRCGRLVIVVVGMLKKLVNMLLCRLWFWLGR